VICVSVGLGGLLVVVLCWVLCVERLHGLGAVGLEVSCLRYDPGSFIWVGRLRVGSWLVWGRSMDGFLHFFAGKEC
jgi:hypothetical protein